MQQNLKSIGNIDVKVNPRLSHFRSPDKIALVQYESTQRKMQKSQKAWNWLGMLTRKWNINYPTFNHLHSHSLKATWIRWEKRKSRILLIWNVETLIIPLSISGSIKLIKLHFSCQALVRASMFISRHHTGGSFQKKHNCQNENYFCDLEYDLILSLAWATGMYSTPKPLWAERP